MAATAPLSLRVAWQNYVSAKYEAKQYMMWNNYKNAKHDLRLAFEHVRLKTARPEWDLIVPESLRTIIDQFIEMWNLKPTKYPFSEIFRTQNPINVLEIAFKALSITNYHRAKYQFVSTAIQSFQTKSYAKILREIRGDSYLFYKVDKLYRRYYALMQQEATVLEE
jgi:hypothetical protein